MSTAVEVTGEQPDSVAGVATQRYYRRFAPIERASACIGVVLESPFMRQRGLGDVLERTRNAWVAAAEKSLASNESTVAVLSVDEILKPDGYVAQLKNRGYVVTDP